MGGVARVGEHGRWATTRWMEGGGDGADKHRPGAVPGRGGIGGRAPGGPQGGHVGRAEAGRVPGARGRGRHDRGTGAGPGRGRAGRRCRPGPGGGGAAARRGRRRRRHGGRAAGWRPAGGALLGGGRGPARRLLRRAVRERPRRAAGDLAAAVRRCWASAFTRHVAAYRQSRGVGRDVAMAVLVQPMVAAEAAGVAFSADPVTGDRDTTVVNAVRGLGDRLVAGGASPDEWMVRGAAATCRAAPEGAIDAEVAADVAALARRVEAQLGAPQDIEWALAGGELVLLQARPITALPDQAPEPEPVPVEVPPGFWEREASHAPKPWTPMTLSALAEARNRAMRRAFAEFGLLAETLEFAQIGGWEYTRLVPLGGKDRPAPPARSMPLLIRLVPRLRRRIADAVAAVRSDKAGRFVEQWYRQWQPDLAARSALLRDTDLGALDDEELDAHITRALAVLEEGFDVHFLLHGALMPILAELAFACRELLGWADEEACELLVGLSTTSTEPARRLAELAGMAARRPAVHRLLGEVDAGTAGRLAETDPEFAEAFAAYQREFARRALRYEIADPSIAELPELTLRLLADQLARGYDPVADAAALGHRRMTAAGRARATLAGRPPGDRERFERALARAERAYPVREDNEFFTASAPIALLRYPVLEIGRRLAARGQLDRRDDVFFLTLDEARAALCDGQDRRALVT